MRRHVLRLLISSCRHGLSSAAMPAQTGSVASALSPSSRLISRASRLSSVQHRTFASAQADYQDKVDEINDMFAEARDYIEDAKEDAETVYFNESAAEAKEYTQQVLDKWTSLLSSLPEQDRAKLQRSMGLKMEQLKAELEQLDHLHA